MATTSGTIKGISVNSTICCVTMQKSGGGTAQFLLWNYGDASTDTAKNRLLHGIFLSLTRDAFIHSQTMSFGHPSGSALVTSVKIL